MGTQKISDEKRAPRKPAKKAVKNDLLVGKYKIYAEYTNFTFHRFPNHKIVVIFDPNALFHKTLAHWLSVTGANLFKIFSFDSFAVGSIAALKKHAPDYVLVNMGEKMESTLTFVAEINTHFEKTRTLIYSSYHNYTYVNAAYKTASYGFFSTSEPPEKLLEVLLSNSNNKYLSSNAAQHLANLREKIDGLSKKEKEVFTYVQQGFANDEISDALEISKHSVENYVTVLYSKMNVLNRAELQTL
jgi:DNA-binding NarL/FixJ family response regulator